MVNVWCPTNTLRPDAMVIEFDGNESGSLESGNRTQQRQAEDKVLSF